MKFNLIVQDHGEGISEEGLKLLFKDFSSLKEHQRIN
jgi:hypothetical protein